MIHDEIKNRRKSKGMTLEELGKKIGTSKQTIARYENGEIANIPYDKVMLLADALCTTPAELMGWKTAEAIDEELIDIVKASQLQMELKDISVEEYGIIKSFRNADDLTKQMVLKILGIK